QTLSLGMTLNQLTNPGRFRAFADLWESHAPAGERLEEYVAREVAGQEHVGETPLDVVEDACHFAARALAAAQAGRPEVSTATAEYDRLTTDARATALIADVYQLRVRAAAEILTTPAGHTGDHCATR